MTKAFKKGKKAAVALRVAEHGPGYISWDSEAGEKTSIVRIRTGFPYAQIRQVQNLFRVPDKDFAHLIGISDKTLARIKKSNARLSALSGDRLYRLMKVWELANKVMENPDNALAWLNRAQPGLDGQAPMDLLDTEPGYEQVQTLLNQLEYGVLP
jgi:putative toxin-antitoxin system antitoxin component (TIGR02293 family)